MNRTSPTERYYHDAQFRQMVDMLYSLILNAEYTPLEIREAIMLAQIKYEELNIRPLIIEAGWPTR